MSRAKAIVSRQTEAFPAGLAWPSRDFIAGAATVGAVVAGAALLEAALIPGVAIGAAAVLTPGGLPWLRRNLAPLLKPAKRRPAAVVKRTSAPFSFPIKQALAKTITYRIIVTTLDFSWNYVVIGEVAAAAGLSAITLAVAPVFYFVHEAAWELFQRQGQARGQRRRRFAGRDSAVGRSRRIFDQSRLGQDDHLPHLRHDDGLRHQLRHRPRSAAGGDVDGIRLRGRPVCLSRP